MELRVISIMKTLEWRKDKSLPVYTGADIKDVRVCNGNIGGAYRSFLDLSVGDIEPIVAAILGFPNAASGITSVKDGFFGGMTDNTIDAAAAHQADETPLERIEWVIAHAASWSAANKPGTQNFDSIRLTVTWIDLSELYNFITPYFTGLGCVHRPSGSAAIDLRSIV